MGSCVRSDDAVDDRWELVDSPPDEPGDGQDGLGGVDFVGARGARRIVPVQDEARGLSLEEEPELGCRKEGFPLHVDFVRLEPALFSGGILRRDRSRSELVAVLPVDLRGGVRRSRGVVGVLGASVGGVEVDLGVWGEVFGEDFQT